MPETYKKKLIEVALPLEAINQASAHEKMPGIGAHPRGLHLWWARRPLAAARAVIFAQMVDDPSAHPELFPTDEAQDAERQRLFRIIERLVKWENTTNETVLNEAREEIRKSWRLTCEANNEHPRSEELFNPDRLPAFHDPFAGGGALPLEAQRLGLEAYASDLNPVAVLINKAMIEIPPKFAGMPPVNPESRKKLGSSANWKGASGLAEDVRYYGQWMRDEAEKRIGHLYPKVEVTAEMARERSDLKQYVGKKLTVIAWLWARTVKSPNPAFSKVDVPLVSNFMLSTKAGKEAYVEPEVDNGEYRFTVKTGKPENPDAVRNGTKLARANFACLMSGMPVSGDYIKSEGKAGRMSVRMMAIVAEGQRGRVYLPPMHDHEAAARDAIPTWRPEGEIAVRMTGGNCTPYGLTSWGDLFTPRQLVTLTAFADLVGEARELIQRHAFDAGFNPSARIDLDDRRLRDGGTGAAAYAEAVAIYLSFAVDRLADFNSSIATWKPSGEQVMQTYKRQAIPMTWDFPESNSLAEIAICWTNSVKYSANSLKAASGTFDIQGHATQNDASSQRNIRDAITSTDPPYYDNIGYADLSDYFYVWLRRSVRDVYPDLFTTIAVPKAEELVASPHRHGSKEKAEKFFLDGMTKAMHNLTEQSHPGFPVTIYYAFKQSETKGNGNVVRTGWETFLAAVIRAGFSVSGTWPMRTELSNRMISSGTNALASSIVLVCRKRVETSSMATRGEFLAALRREIGGRIRTLQSGSVAPVDLPQSSIGPGMEIYTRYSRVLEADGSSMGVGAALNAINEILDEVLAEQEGEYDPATRWAISWFEQHGMREGAFGDADNLARARGTSVDTLRRLGIVEAGGSKVRLLSTSELSDEWAPTGGQLTIWEAAHRMILAHDTGGVDEAGRLAALLGGDISSRCRLLADRLYSIADRNHWTDGARAYNGLGAGWSSIVAAGERQRGPVQSSF